ncbi:hypothetical protein HanXRQr2_Chr11g0470661 [Helianthus annuus]|uniref:Membrane-associated kinase regulator n=1 Tax=Helianthus annuus TaxID=4232 RepID=A0A251T7B8_HELAN|nr:uncharacterized protein LOC110889452 [Helianthus annuus]KAF5780330.1 hypothetical protein HanXRQr2_Chr11g0470661 [Helianthus annuus]KAJ0500149.1 hypothetical protein HanHA300_Chr11g0386441 [Helianthus annuus]KAJ0515991.1 hypothetical protein HanHA89_Chr11g0408881 [Helianthus annuus]KAJ0684000.1 hypothetical protein HanLR1_Chr11g0386421 [Helianthus annuus]
MTTDLYSDNSSVTTMTASPRISFSYDLSQEEAVPVERLLRSCSSSNVDFNFFVHENSDLHQVSNADELFLDGKILPTPMRSKTQKNKTSLSLSQPENEKSRSLAATEDERIKQQNANKSFWGFKRSSSCGGSGYAKSLCSIVSLSRSHSMGSSTSSKQTCSSSKEGFNQKRQGSVQKPPPLRKTGYGYGSYAKGTTGNGIRVSPVLNLGFGSFLYGNSKIKNKK